MFQRCVGLAVGGVAYLYARNEQRRVKALAQEIPTWIDPFSKGAFATCAPRLAEIVYQHLSEEDQAREELKAASESNWNACHLTPWRGKPGLNALLPEVRAKILFQAEGRPFPLGPILVGATAMVLSGSWLSGVGGAAIVWGALALRRPDFEEPASLAKHLSEKTPSTAPEVQPIIEARTDYESRIKSISTLAAEASKSHPDRAKSLTAPFRANEILRALKMIDDFKDRAEKLSAEPPNYPALIAKARSALLLRSYRAQRDQQPTYRSILALLLGTFCLWRSL